MSLADLLYSIPARIRGAYDGFIGTNEKTRLQLESLLQLRNTELFELITNMPTAVVKTDCTPEQIILAVNPAFLSLYKYERDDVIGKPISILRPPHSTDMHLMNQIYRDTLAGKSWNFRVKNIDSEGTIIPIQLHTAANYGVDKTTPTSLIATMADYRGIEEREELKAREALAAGTLHDVRNPLTGALLALDQLLITGNDATARTKFLATIELSITRAIEILNQVNSFKPNTMSPTEIDITTIEDYITRRFKNTGIMGFIRVFN